MAFFQVNTNEAARLACKCGHAWSSPVTIEATRVDLATYTWERGEIKVGVKARLMDVYCSRCAAHFDRVTGVIEGEDVTEGPVVAEAPVVPEAHAAPETTTSARFEVEEISAAI
jgi:alkyl sulfatase BDS1-like metallo-beta-lactamase superfamily hydrolase